MAKSKYYVVWKGHIPGIYKTWEECQQQITGFQNAHYKSYPTYEEAVSAYKNGKDNQSKPKLTFTHKIDQNSICVDAACSGNPGEMEYRGVETSSGREIFRVGPYPEGTNNIGEFLALVHALALLKKVNKPDMVIYSDSVTAMAWVRNKKIKTNLNRTEKNKPVFELMERALDWLQANTFTQKIMKWETEKWGEIPADFGRK
ncbi:MAG: ribonuclease H family protein [Saprospiraceae bacterium]|nr:ribonuclease H family protein [Saprospiraceae bacterium]MBK6564202.1 ribonuclease H family protein [Saprospiraceae bacterium]MBK6782364.1 ribonuclease H family protein [Saprospiraceae bacterium]MBK7524118.1 ribonuclease H family protein [Saprospiraceae bacterium]MBK8372170.1 ribonuclease H family protein [Saprospiraceae bacterium]